nr:transporter [uncultured Marinifilum sp.]
MKRLLFLGLILLSFASVKAQQETGYYTFGVEGIKTASLPGPGFYYKMYNAYYSSDKLMDGNGDEMDIDFDVNVFANTHRFIYITNKKFLGADYGMNIIVPLVSTDISIGAFGVSDSQFALADITVEPLILSWHGAKYDAAFAVAAILPVGKYDMTEAASAGKGMWTGMLTFGGTYYFDKNKSWAASALGRYETHSEKDDYDVTPGDVTGFEWGLSKTMPREKAIWEVGITGYASWQITDDKGDDVLYDANDHDRQFAIGPSVRMILPKSKIVLSIQGQKEFGVKDRSEGFMSCLSFIKGF